MIEYLSDVLDNFLGSTHQTRCFSHTINLCAKSILRPFDTHKKKDVLAFNDAVRTLAELADENDLDGSYQHHEQETGNDEGEGREEEEQEEDGEDGENQEYNMNVQPIRLVLTKVG